MLSLRNIIVLALLLVIAIGAVDIAISLSSSAHYLFVRFKPRSRSDLMKAIESRGLLESCLFLSSPYYPDNHLRDTQEKFKGIVTDIKEKLNGSENASTVITYINESLYEEYGMESTWIEAASSLLPNRVLENKRGHCLGLSILYSAIGEALDIPIYTQVIPGHAFVCHDDEQLHVNIETTSRGAIYSDNVYGVFIPRAQKSYQYYLRNLTREELCGMFLCNLGVYLEREGKSKQALSAYQEALALAPESADAYCKVGQAYKRLGKKAEARRYLARAVKLDPGSWVTHESLGILSFGECKYQEAAQWFLQAIELAIEANKTMWFVKIAPEAENQLKELATKLMQSPNANDYGLSAFGCACMIKGHYTLAVQLLERVYKRAQADGSVCSSLADAHFHLGHYEKAREYRDIAVTKLGHKLSNGSIYYIDVIATLYKWLGRSYSKQGQHVPAIEFFNKALQIGGENRDLCFLLGETYVSLGNTALAAIYFERTLVLDPTHKPSQKALEKVMASEEYR